MIWPYLPGIHRCERPLNRIVKISENKTVMVLTPHFSHTSHCLRPAYIPDDDMYDLLALVNVKFLIYASR